MSESISETMRARGEDCALSDASREDDERATVIVLRKERDALKAEVAGLRTQFAEIASIKGLTESEEGLPGSVRDLVRTLSQQRDIYLGWYRKEFARLDDIKAAMEGYDD